MTTSGTYTFSQNRDQIIKSAARKIGAFAAGETPDAQTMSDFSDALNAMVKRWQGSGIHIWTQAEGTLFLQQSQARYTLSSTSTDHATESFVETSIGAVEASGQTTITLSSVTGISATNNIGIQLDDGTMHWTTVSSVSTPNVVIALALTDSAAAGNLVVAYATNLIRPLRVEEARSYDFDDARDTPVRIMSRNEYFGLPSKTSTGTPNGVFYDPRGGANNSGYLYVWPVLSSVDSAIKFTFMRPIQDFSAAGDTPDLPQEWIDTLVFNLAVVMAPEYDVAPEKFMMLQQLANQFLDDLKAWDREPESIFFGVDYQ